MSLFTLNEQQLGDALAAMSVPQREAFLSRQRWLTTARPNQLPPEGDDWDVWMAVAGRGFGKTRCINEVVADWALWYEPLKKGDVYRVAIVAPTFGDLTKITFEGDSGLLSVIPEECRKNYNRSEYKLELYNGAMIYGFSAEEPDRLRGNQFHLAACEELCAWDKQRENWDMLQFCLRLGAKPKTLISTTPKGQPLIRELRDYSLGKRPRGMDPFAAIPKVVMTSGTSYENKDNLPKTYFSNIGRYEGTERGREEIHAEILDDASGAIIKREWWKVWAEPKWPRPERIVVSVDSAFKLGKRNDWTAITVWGLFWVPFNVKRPDPVAPDRLTECTEYGWIAGLVSATRVKATFPELKRLLKAEFWEWARRFRFRPERDGLHASPVEILIEDAASGIPLAQELKEAGLPIRVAGGFKVKINTPNRKVEMAHLVSDLFKDKLVYAIGRPDPVSGVRSKKELDPGEGGMIDECVDECEKFNREANASGPSERGAPHDDFVDSLTQALETMRLDGYLVKSGDVDRRPRKPRAELERDEDESAAQREVRKNPYG